jgi:hypothetical protein
VSALITAPVRRTHFHGTEPDPNEIMLSSHIRLGTDSDAGPVVDTVATPGELGLDPAAVILPLPRDRAVRLATVADSLTSSRK